MNEPNLAKAIDKAAEQRAKDIIRKIQLAITTSLQPYWRPTNAGDEFIGDDIRELLKKLAEANSDWRTMQFVPSQQMISACRGAIINDLLNGLPKLRQLAQMAGDENEETE